MCEILYSYLFINISIYHTYSLYNQQCKYNRLLTRYAPQPVCLNYKNIYH